VRPAGTDAAAPAPGWENTVERWSRHPARTDGHLAAVLGDDAMHDGRAKPGTFGEVLLNGWKRPSSSSVVMSTAPVLDAEYHRRALPRRASPLFQRSRACPRRACAEPVRGEVPDHLALPCDSSTVDGRWRAFCLDGHAVPIRELGAVPQEDCCLPEHGAQVDTRERRGRGLA